MSSMTIDQLKKSLTEQGITLPPSRSKKADYVKLYKQYSTLNDSLGDVYSSDDENPPRSSSQSVTSSSSPSKGENIAKDVEQLSDDELYLRLKEFDDKIGPVLKNTRRVYEKKLIKILTSGKQTNGYESQSSKQNEKFTPSIDEFSDSDVDIISKSPKKETKGRKGSMLRDSPKPSSAEPSKTDTEKSYYSYYDYPNRSSTPAAAAAATTTTTTTTSEIKPTRFSYIETGSSYSYIKPDRDVGFSSSDIRQRFSDRFDLDKFSSDKYITSKSSTSDAYKPSVELGDSHRSGLGSTFKSGFKSDDYKSEYKPDYKYGFISSSQYKPGLGRTSQFKSGDGFAERYTGTWEPDINRYLSAGVQQKKVSSNAKGYNIASWFKNFLAAVLLFLMLVLIIYIYHQWSSTDPYKLIEDDAERQILEGSGNL